MAEMFNHIVNRSVVYIKKGSSVKPFSTSVLTLPGENTIQCKTARVTKEQVNRPLEFLILI